jgi:hypothetical protein
MLKIFMDAFAILTGFATCVNNIFDNTLTEVAVRTVLIQLNG